MNLSFHYTEKLDLRSIQGVDENRPWYVLDVVAQLQNIHNSLLLDIGCGTAKKIITLADHVNFLVAMEPNELMLKKASKNITDKKINNILLVKGFSEFLPFPDNQFDIVTVMLAPHHTKEIYRVLKPGGYAVLEKIGDDDKTEFKNCFGSDSIGHRGFLCGQSKENRIELYEKEFSELFNQMTLKNGEWNTYYSIEGLRLLLEETPTVRNFDWAHDKNIILTYAKKYSTSRGIQLKQNRILIVAKK